MSWVCCLDAGVRRFSGVRGDQNDILESILFG